MTALQDYANLLLHADLSSDVIRLPDKLPRVIPVGLRHSIMIRPCYRQLLQRLLDLGPDFGAVLSGTPGIGKSAFAVYLMCALAQQRQKVMYRHFHWALGFTILYFDFSDATNVKVDTVSVNSGNTGRLSDAMDDPTVWWLQDGKAPPTEFIGSGKFIVMSSSNINDWNGFEKGRNTHVLWLPVWTLAELLQCQELFFPDLDKEVVETRFLQFGGSVRYVLVKQEETLKRLALDYLSVNRPKTSSTI